MKQFLAIILFLPIFSVNVALAESHLSKDAEQAEKFEKSSFLGNTGGGVFRVARKLSTCDKLLQGEGPVSQKVK